MEYKITTPKGTFGRYQHVDVLPDRYRADGADLPFSVVGEGTVEPAGNWYPPAPPAAPEPVPESVSARQAWQALFLRGRIDDVEPAIAAIADPVMRGLVLIEWNKSQEFERNRPSLIALGAALGYDSAGLDDLFRFAKGL